ncbi:MAG: two pore domain potassium channel family protein [Nocardioidaceae bacterium]|nr:two pore domain potassium channel family protein [Nocardioidaceae bacterium]
MSWIQKAKDTPSALLLFVQLAGVLLYPFMEETRAGRALFSALGIIVLALAVLTVRRTPSFTWVSICLATPALILLVAQLFSSASWLTTWSAAFEAPLYFYAAVGLIRYMFADHIVTTDELWAVGATFTLVAWGFAYIYVVVQAVAPGSFTAAVGPDQARSWMELLFLSFTTLSSTGLSDVVPIAAFARSVVMLEQLAGLLYVAMVVSRMVGLTFPRLGVGSTQPQQGSSEQKPARRGGSGVDRPGRRGPSAR